jgi:uncharacterized membrane protein YkvA (DUF1232 family)
MKMESERVVIDLTAQERRLYDRLRSSILRKRPGEGSRTGDLILLLPDFCVLLWRLMRDPRVPIGGKAIGLLGLSYVVSPIDLLPAFLLGPFGWLDDLLVVSAALSRVLNYVHPDVVRSHWSGQGDALEAIQRLTEWSESVLTRRLPRALGQLGRLGRR